MLVGDRFGDLGSHALPIGLFAQNKYKTKYLQLRCKEREAIMHEVFFEVINCESSSPEQAALIFPACPPTPSFENV